MQTRLDIILETVSRILEAEQKGRKPDYLDFDKDGNKKEPMVDAIKDAKEKKRYPEKDPYGGVRRVRPGHGDLEQG
jgi:hypothetical protein